MSYLSKGLYAIAALAAFVSCSTRYGEGVGPQAYHRALNQAFDELKARSPEGREVASERSVAQEAGADFSKLRGSIEVIVFPKFGTLAEKRASAVRLDFGRPIVYTMNVVRNLSCGKLVREGADQWSHRENFKDADARLDCAILRIFQSEPKRVVANARQGDVKETHLYIDSNYAVYGYDHEILRTRRDSEVVRVKTDATVASGSSGLGLAPIDLPPANAQLAILNFDRPVIASEDAFVKRKLQEFRVSLSCSRGTHVAYRDIYGQRNDVQWCRGDVWPTVLENDRFLAVLKRGK
jgi:hypothetical protein